MTLHVARLNRLERVCWRCCFSSPSGLTLAGRASGVQPINPAKSADCRVEAVDYKGWHAQQISNRWVQLIVVPQNGGRLMQVTFAGHAYLFVNPKFAGKYLAAEFRASGSTTAATSSGSCPKETTTNNIGSATPTVLDDGPFTFRKLSEGQRCEIELTGPADPQTGIQFMRTIRLDADSPRIALSRVHEEHDRPYAGVVDAVRLAIRHRPLPNSGAQARRAAHATTISGRSLRRTDPAVISTAITFASVRRRILQSR